MKLIKTKLNFIANFENDIKMKQIQKFKTIITLILTVNLCLFAKKIKGYHFIWLKINKYFMLSFDY